MPANNSYPKEYRLAPTLRRSCWYVIVSIPLILFAITWVKPSIEHAHDKVFFHVIMSGIFLGIAVLTTIPLFWKIRLDEKGISRFSFFRWDFWSWDDIASGRIKKTDLEIVGTLCDSSRSFGNRSLVLHLTLKEYQEVLAAINEHCQLPPPPEIPESIIVENPFYHVATFDQTGIHRIVRKKKQDYLWDDVIDVHIFRVEPLCRYFTQIVITLPDDESKRNEIIFMRGMVPKPEELNELLHEKVSPDKIHVSLVGQPLTKRRHIERRLKFVKKEQRSILKSIPVFFIISIGILVWAFYYGDLQMKLTIGFFTPILPIAFGMMYRTYSKELQELEKSLESLDQ